MSLDTPHRWEEVPELGLWLRDLREALRDGREVGWDAAPDCVKLVPVQGRAPHGNSLGMPTYTALRGALISIPADHTVGLLAWRNKTISIVQRALRSQGGSERGRRRGRGARGAARRPWRGRVRRRHGEGSGRPAGELSVGCNANIRGMLDACLEDDGLSIGRRQSVAHLADVFRPLYERPDLSTWSECLGRLCDAVATGGATPSMRVEPFQLLAALQVPPDQDWSTRTRPPPQPSTSSSAAHRLDDPLGQGARLDHVIVTHAGTADFPDTIDGRRLLYTRLLEHGGRSPSSSPMWPRARYCGEAPQSWRGRARSRCRFCSATWVLMARSTRLPRRYAGSQRP